MSFVDVGANWGYFTLLAAHLVGKEGRVVSVEPDPRLFPILQENVTGNRLDQVTALQLAAAAETGTVALVGYDESGGNFGISRVVSYGKEISRTFRVAARPLDRVFDDLKLDAVDLLKMDIEGSEGIALRGLARALAGLGVRRLLLELHPAQLADHGQSAKDVIGCLRDVGYRGWRVDHSLVANRRAAYAERLDVRAFLRPFDAGAPLDDWPHLLWAMPGLEALS